MTRTNQATQKTRRAVDDLDAYCHQLERLARRVSRIAVKGNPDRADYDVIAPLDEAMAKLEVVVAKLKQAAPRVAVPVGESDSTIATSTSPCAVENPTIADALTELAVNPEDEILPRSEQQPGECVLHGTSPSLTVPTVLEFLASQRKSGTLIVRTESETFSIELADGQIVHAVSDCTPLEERLGSILLQRGLIGTEQLQDVLNASPGGMLGVVLVEENLVSRDDLLATLEHQAALLFRRLFAHHRTQFSFCEGGSTGLDLHIEANVTMLLLEGARTNDESQLQPSTDWSEWLQ